MSVKFKVKFCCFNHSKSFTAIVVWGLICYPEEYLLHEEVFDDMSHTQRLEVVSVLGNLSQFLLS